MAYGLEVYNSSGNTVLSYTSRVPRFVQNGTFRANGNSNTVTTVSGMANNDSWGIFASIIGSSNGAITFTKNTGSFTTNNKSAVFVDIAYWIIRS